MKKILKKISHFPDVLSTDLLHKDIHTGDQ